MSGYETDDQQVQTSADRYFAGITGALGGIAEDWAALNEIPISGGAVGGGGSGETRLPGGTQRLNLIADGTRLLMQWCLVVLDERELPGTSIDPTDVPATCRWLREHARWLSEHDTGFDADEELRQYAGQVRSMVAPTGARKIPIGKCPKDECPGVVKAKITGDSEVDADQDLVCDVDREHIWSSGQYHELAAALGNKTEVWLTVAELATYLSAHFGRTITESKIRRWQRTHPVSLPLRAGKLDRVAVAMHAQIQYCRNAQAA